MQIVILAISVSQRLCCAVHVWREQENVQIPCGRRDSHLLAFFLINQIKIRKKQKLEEPDFYLQKEMMTGSVTSNEIFFLSCLWSLRLLYGRLYCQKWLGGYSL